MEQRDPADLRLHPALKCQHQLGDESPEFLALVDDISCRGIDYPIIITQDGQIMDGRHRWRAAKRLQLTQVPVTIRDEADAATLILAEIIERRHYTKGQVAYTCFPLLKDAHNELVKRKISYLKAGNVPRSALSALRGMERVETEEDLAQFLGISRRLFQQAAQLHKAFDGPHSARRQEFEDKIFDPERPMGLGAALAGIGWLNKYEPGTPRTEPRQMDLFTQAFETLRIRWDYWTKADEDTRRAVLPQIREKIQAAVVEMPDDIRRLWKAAIKSAEKESESA